MAVHLLNSSYGVSMQEHTFYAFETLVRLKLSVPSILRGKYFLRRSESVVMVSCPRICSAVKVVTTW